jgi:hypothetical protein
VGSYSSPSRLNKPLTNFSPDFSHARTCGSPYLHHLASCVGIISCRFWSTITGHRQSQCSSPCHPSSGVQSSPHQWRACLPACPRPLAWRQLSSAIPSTSSFKRLRQSGLTSASLPLVGGCQYRSRPGAPQTAGRWERAALDPSQQQPAALLCSAGQMWLCACSQRLHTSTTKIFGLTCRFYFMLPPSTQVGAKCAITLAACCMSPPPKKPSYNGTYRSAFLLAFLQTMTTLTSARNAVSCSSICSTVWPPSTLNRRRRGWGLSYLSFMSESAM